VQGFIEIPFFTQSGTLFWVLLALLVASSRLQRESDCTRIRKEGAMSA
jgi:hypothetical protein